MRNQGSGFAQPAVQCTWNGAEIAGCDLNRILIFKKLTNKDSNRIAKKAAMVFSRDVLLNSMAIWSRIV